MRAIKLKFLLAVISSMIMFFQVDLLAKGTEDATKIIKKAESIRTIERARSRVSVITVNGKTKTRYQMSVLQGSERRAYLEFTKPKEEVGRRMLAIKTRYWSKFPDSRRVVSISRKEAIGNSAFAIADVFQMDVDDDYSAKKIGEETFANKRSYKIELNAKNTSAPYHRILYFVRAEDSQPIKAEFYAPSGVLLKVMTVEKSKKIIGMMRPSLLKMVDHVVKGRVSWWRTHGSEIAKVRDEVFTKAYLKGR